MRSVSGTAVLLLGSTLLVGAGAPARAADYDPSSLCPSATPSNSAMATSLATVRSNTEAAINAAGGLNWHLSDKTEKSAYRVDLAKVRSRYDSIDDDGTKRGVEHTIVDANTTTKFSGYLRGDGIEERAGLKALGKGQVWIKSKAVDDEYLVRLTADDMIAGGLDEISSLGDLQSDAVSTTQVPTFTCKVSAGKLLVTDSVPMSGGGKLLKKYTLSFTATGALSASASTFSLDGKPVNSPQKQTYAYTGFTLGVPSTSLITTKAWLSAQRQGYFALLKDKTVAASKAQVAKLDTQAERVAAVRKIAKDKANYYGGGQVTSVADGVRVSKRKYGLTTNWWFRVRVSGADVKVTTNLP